MMTKNRDYKDLKALNKAKKDNQGKEYYSLEQVKKMYKDNTL